MVLLGIDVSGDSNSFTYAYSSSTVDSYTLSNALVDDFYVSRDATEFDDAVNNGEIVDLGYNSSTVFYSNYNDSTLSSSNFTIDVDELSAIRIKRREVGETTWTTLFEQEVDGLDSLKFDFVDKYARGRDTEYEYAAVPVDLSGAELSQDIITVKSSFDGAMICDKDTTYHILLEPAVSSTTLNRTATTVTTMNNKYPFVFFGSNANYFTGSFSGVAIKLEDENGDYTNDDIIHSTKYRNILAEWLTNGEPKILKMFDGREWMISVDGNVNLDYSEHYDKVTVSFDFVEIGDYDDTDDLYNHNLIDFNY